MDIDNEKCQEQSTDYIEQQLSARKHPIDTTPKVSLLNFCIQINKLINHSLSRGGATQPCIFGKKINHKFD